MKTRSIAAIILSLILILSVCSCGKNADTVDSSGADTSGIIGFSTVSTTSEQIDVSTVPAASERTESSPVPTDDPSQVTPDSGSGKFINIETPYGILKFPEELTDALVTDIDDIGEGVCKVSFYANFGERTYPLYVIGIGTGEGEDVGELTGPDSVARRVYLTVVENDLSDVSEEDVKMSVYAMQETLNDIISNLR